MKFPIFFRRQPKRPVKLLPLAQRRPRRWRKPLKIAGIILGGLILVVGLFGLTYYSRARTALAGVRGVQAAAAKLPQDFADQRFSQAQTHVEELQAALTRTSQAVDRMQGLRFWPYIGRQYRAVEDVLEVGQEGAEAVSALVEFADHVFAPFAGQGTVSLSKLTTEQKGQLLAGISQREADLRLAQQAVERASEALDRIPENGLLPPLQRAIYPLKQQFPLIDQGLTQAIPAARILPLVLGYPEEKTYLFLLQNNTELRPGGGFIGTYGIMRMQSGEIVSLATDNSYNLDEAAKSLPRVQPPEPIVKYLKVNNWYFRDANWSPDFPTSARQALVLYQREGGRRDVDGVMAITPTVVTALLKLVGSITIDGMEFTDQNFTDRLQRFVDAGFQSAGLDESQRKDIIGPLTKTLVDRILQLPLSEWGELFLTISQQLREKQLLMYMHDPSVQSVLADQNWAGAITSQEDQDYVMVVDANLASLKSDPVVERQYDYQVHIGETEAEATLKITYHHTGKFDWKTTRYNTFVRVYVPAGSELLETTGAQLREKSQQAGKVSTTTELGQTVFSAFKSVEPLTDGVFVLRYRLPKQIVSRWRNQGDYGLNWQKQPGLTSAKIHLNLVSLDRRPSQFTGLDNQARLGKDSIDFIGSLREDRLITIQAGE